MAGRPVDTVRTGQIGVEIPHLETDRASDQLTILEHRPELGRELRHPRGAGLEIHLDRDLARGHDLRRRRAHAPLAHQHERGPERRVPRERELRRRREDPHRVPVTVALGHERRLREPDLLRERLHRRVVQVDGLRDDAELVPGERSRREHVDEPEGDVHAAHCSGCTRGHEPSTGGCYRWS